MQVVITTYSGLTSCFSSVLFALCESGYIIQVCLHTLTPVALFSQFPVGDFVVLEGSGDSSEECSLMALVHRPEHAIVLISWPGL